MTYDDKVKRIIEEIVRERDWREREFSVMKGIYLRLKENEKSLKTYATMCIPIIYAHWEGFCVTIFRHVCDFVNQQNLNHDQLSISLFTFSKSRTYDYLKGKQSFEQRCKFSKSFIDALNANTIVIPNRFNTKSNLKYDMLGEMLEIFELDANEVVKYKRDLNKLVEIRNHIAHGENSIIVSERILLDNMTLVLSLIDELIVIFENFLNNKSYLKCE